MATGTKEKNDEDMSNEDWRNDNASEMDGHEMDEDEIEKGVDSGSKLAGRRVSEYERKREENIAQNRKILDKLMKQHPLGNVGKPVVAKKRAVKEKRNDKPVRNKNQ